MALKNIPTLCARCNCFQQHAFCKEWEKTVGSVTVGKHRRHQNCCPGLRAKGEAAAAPDTAGPTWSPWCTTRSRRPRRPGTPSTSSTGCRQPPSPESSAQQQHSCFQMCHRSPTGAPAPPGHTSTATFSWTQGTSTSGCDTLTLSKLTPHTTGADPGMAWELELCHGHLARGWALEAAPLGASGACPSQRL